jgi:hypothetical protein
MLRKFRDQLPGPGGDGATKAPPFVIRASDLDKNFGLCYPLPVEGNNAAYTIERPSEDGFRLVGNKIFDVCENGRPAKYRFFAQRLPSS